MNTHTHDKLERDVKYSDATLEVLVNLETDLVQRLDWTRNSEHGIALTNLVNKMKSDNASIKSKRDKAVVDAASTRTSAKALKFLKTTTSAKALKVLKTTYIKQVMAAKHYKLVKDESTKNVVAANV
jgi:hypothetical protein